MSELKPIKVAIVGGGCASIAAAFELSRPEHHGRYEITVYQLGWRLGGKAASGRGPADRIEEHGLHMWLGFYENAFRLTRECYAELGRDRAASPMADWQDAFEPVPLIGITDRRRDGRWYVWQGALPATEGLPGDPSPDGKRFTMGEYVRRAIDLVRALFETIQRESALGPEPSEASRGNPEGSDSSSSPSRVAETVSRLLVYGELASLAALTQAVGLLEVLLGSLSAYPENLVLRFIDAIASNARSLLDERLEQDLAIRRIWQVIDVTLATLRGEVRFGIMTDPRGFDAIDEYDTREWLLLNGASEDSVNSGFIRALYDLGLAYEDGDPAKPSVSAAQGLRSMVRAFFTYRGSFFWRMKAGMGDAVFAPFYEVLKRRGVRFEFFHRLENVRLAAPAEAEPGESPHVEALEFDLQARVLGEYDPLVEVHGLPCWPAAPDYAQLVDGERLQREGHDFESFWDSRKIARKVLRVGEDFDLVVLGVGLGAIPHVCRDIVARDPRWRTMIDHVRTVATQAFQIWMDADMEQLGWPGPQIAVCGFVEPFDTWADMRHLLGKESWPTPPRSLAYFCNVLPDLDEPSARTNPEYPRRQREQVRRNAIRFMNQDLPLLWPLAARRPGEFDWERLIAADERSAAAEGEERFATQFWTANVNPSDRYTLAIPGSSAYRISPLDATYDNLTVCGDWTSCGFNAGCVEAAIMSGRLAAHAIARSPRLEDIVGYDHP